MINRMNVIFRYSFLGRITEIREEGCLKEVLENSRFVKRLLKMRNKYRKRVASVLETGSAGRRIVQFKNELYIFPVKVGSIIIVIAILFNVSFYVLFRNTMCKEMGLLGWIIEGILLSMGLVGIFCKAGLIDLMETSLFIKWINRCKQSESEDK